MSLISYAKIDKPIFQEMKKDRNILYENEEIFVEKDEEFDVDKNLDVSNSYFESEMKKKLKKKEESKITKSLIEDLSSLPINVSDKYRMTVEDNIVSYEKLYGCGTCLIGTPMENGVFRLTFEIIEGKCSLGVLDGSLENIKYNKSISESKAGIEVFAKNCVITFIFNLYFRFFEEIFEKLIGKSKSKEKESVLYTPTVIVYDKSHIIRESFSRLSSNTRLTVELDLRSNDPKKRRAYFYVNGYPIHTFFYGLPSVVRFGVFYISIEVVIFLIFIFIYILLLCYSLNYYSLLLLSYAYIEGSLQLLLFLLNKF